MDHEPADHHPHGHHPHGTDADDRHRVLVSAVGDALAGVDLGPATVVVGPGPGVATDVLRARTGRLVAVELDGARARALHHRLGGSGVTVVRGDATALGLADGTFTGAASFHMLHHVGGAAAQDRALAELARVLAPGGTLVVADGTGSFGPTGPGGDHHQVLEPAAVAPRLAAAGFTVVRTGRDALGWWAVARAPGGGAQSAPKKAAPKAKIPPSSPTSQ